MVQTLSASSLSQVFEMNPSIILPVIVVLGSDLVRRAQSIPGLAPLSIGWPEFLISLAARGSPTFPIESPCTVINTKSGYARTNRSAPLEHLLRSHTLEPSRRGLTLTFLYTSERPGRPVNDAVSYVAAATVVIQLGATTLLALFGVASIRLVWTTVAGIVLSTTAGHLLRGQQQRQMRSAREISPERRDVVCITSGNGSAEAIVVVNEGGGARVEDLAAGRASTLGFLATVGVGVLIVLWAMLLLTLTTLDRIDAWTMLALIGVGSAHTAYAARTWRSGAAIGFKFAEERKKVVHSDKVMDVLMKAEEAEVGVGAALLPVFFPGPLRPEEEIWWAERKHAPKASKRP
ncbi:hypothetical protein C8Q79DRAFT_979056 [Trametes meyenii]|nr:hypothetical protein C8Q79DRAFT_979056 [Trametes meyenii]